MPADARAFRDLLAARDRDPSHDRYRSARPAARRPEREPERPELGALPHSPSAFARVEAAAPNPSITRRAEADAMIERVVESLRLGRVGADDQRVRMRLALGRGSVDVELVHDPRGLSATLRSDDPRLAASLHARLQREFDAAGIGDSTIEVDD